MATARTKTKPSSAAASRNSRQGRKAPENVVREDDHNVQTDFEDSNEQIEDDEPSSSQGTAVQSMIIGSLSNQKKRHVVNKKKVKEDYSATKAKLQDTITALFDAHEDQSRTAHNTQLQRLADLLTTKSTIESQMTARLAHLRALYDVHSKELTSVLDARIKDLQ